LEIFDAIDRQMPDWLVTKTGREILLLVTKIIQEKVTLSLEDSEKGAEIILNNLYDVLRNADKLN
jgi:hypothetical protein